MATNPPQPPAPAAPPPAAAGSGDPPPPPASKLWTTSFGVYLALLNLALVYLILRVWPGETPMPEKPAQVIIIPGYFTPTIYPEARYLCLVFLIGALGAYIHLATSFTEFLGNRKFVSSWKWWYGLRPFIGSALAMMVYFAARGGLVSGTTGAKDLSPYGIAALAGLAGMFSKQATDKLREVFENLFKTTNPPHREDPSNAPQNPGGAKV